MLTVVLTFITSSFDIENHNSSFLTIHDYLIRLEYDATTNKPIVIRSVYVV